MIHYKTVTHSLEFSVVVVENMLSIFSTTTTPIPKEPGYLPEKGAKGGGEFIFELYSRAWDLHPNSRSV